MRRERTHLSGLGTSSVLGQVPSGSGDQDYGLNPYGARDTTELENRPLANLDQELGVALAIFPVFRGGPRRNLGGIPKGHERRNGPSYRPT